MKRYNCLPEDGKSKLNGDGMDLYVTGTPAQTPIEPHFLYPNKDGKPVASPVPLKILAKSSELPK